MSSTDYLSSGPLSLDEIITALRVQARDENATPVFDDDEIKLAIRQAVLSAYGKYFQSASYELTYTGGTLEYTLNNDIRRIIRIIRARSGIEADPHTINGISVGETVTNWQHFPIRNANTLVFTRDYPDCTMTVYYERDIDVPIDNRTASGSHTAAATTLALTSASPQLWRVALPAYFKWENEIIKITAVASNTSATIVRAQFGTTAAIHASGTELSYLIWADSDRFYNFLMAECGRLLNLWRIQSGSGQVDVSANVTAQRLFKEDRNMYLDEIPQSQKPRRMHFVKTRRPRRGI